MSDRSNPLRISIVGPAGSGKLTALRSLIGNVPVQQRGRLTPVESESDVLLTIRLGTEDPATAEKVVPFELWTVHGEVSSTLTWRTLLSSAEGIIFLADAHGDRLTANENNLRRVREALESLGLDPEAVPWVFAWNQRDLAGEQQVDALASTLNLRGAPAFETVAATGYGLLKVLKSIRDQILAQRERDSGTIGEERPEAEAVPVKEAATPPEERAVAEPELKTGAGAEEADEGEPSRMESISEPPQSGFEALPAVDSDEITGENGEEILPGYAPVNLAERGEGGGEPPRASETAAETEGEISTGVPAEEEHPRQPGGALAEEGEEAGNGAGEAAIEAGEREPIEKATPETEPPSSTGKKSFGFNTRSSDGLIPPWGEEVVAKTDAPSAAEKDSRAQGDVEKSAESESEKSKIREERADAAHGPTFRFPEVKTSGEAEASKREDDEDEKQDRGGLWRRLARNIRNRGN